MPGKKWTMFFAEQNNHCSLWAPGLTKPASNTSLKERLWAAWDSWYIRVWTCFQLFGAGASAHLVTMILNSLKAGLTLCAGGVTRFCCRGAGREIRCSVDVCGEHHWILFIRMTLSLNNSSQ